MNGARLRQLRKNKGVTQQKLADYLSVNLSTVGKWEIHNVTPATDLLVKLADYFEVTTDYLLGSSDSFTASPTALPEAQKVLLDLFRQVPEDKQALVVQMIKTAISELNKI